MNTDRLKQALDEYGTPFTNNGHVQQQWDQVQLTITIIGIKLIIVLITINWYCGSKFN